MGDRRRHRLPADRHLERLPGLHTAGAGGGQPGGLWSIGYDEFGYAKVYHDDVAWIENASGQWVQPYALNIAAALQTAVLAPDTSQTLINVYASTNPLAYPISAYSYILYQCAPTPTRPTCKSKYSTVRGHEHHGQIHAIYRMYRPDKDGNNRLLSSASPTEPVHGERHRIHDRPSADNPHSQELRQPAVPRGEPGGRRQPARRPHRQRRFGSTTWGILVVRRKLLRGSQVWGEGHGQVRGGEDVERKDRGGGGGDGYRIEGAWDVRRIGIHNDKRIFERFERSELGHLALAVTGGLRGSVGRA